MPVMVNVKSEVERIRNDEEVSQVQVPEEQTADQLQGTEHQHLDVLCYI